jgi:hypothetical protein
MNRYQLFFIYFLFSYVIGDIVTTSYGVFNGCIEINPLINFLTQFIGFFDLMFLVKFSSIILVLIIYFVNKTLFMMVCFSGGFLGGMVTLINLLGILGVLYV